MKANLPKTFYSLSKSEQDRILKQMEDTMDNELCLAQFIWIKMACSILHDMGLDKDDIIVFIGSWKRMYRANSRLHTKEEQDAFLNPRMAKIFGEGGFPEEFMQSMKEIGR